MNDIILERPVKNRTQYSILSLSALALAVSPLVAAQQLEEVIVTAQKRSESLQDTALSVVALSQKDLEVRQISSLRDLTVGLPSLQAYDFPTTTNNVSMFMRGLGNTDSQTLTLDNPIGIYVDGVYIARTSGAAIDVLDLERIEVLRGPQGTLYGRNSSSGAINFVSAKPSEEFGGYLKAGAGNFGAWNAAASVDLPLSDTFRAKFSAMKSNFDGWVDNTGFNEVPGVPYEDFYMKEQSAVRAALQWTPSDAVSIDYSFDNSEVDSTPMYYQTETNGRVESTANVNIPGLGFAFTMPIAEQDTWGHALTVSWELNDTLTLKSISGYREMEEEVYQNWADSLFFGTNLEWATEAFSQELQLSSEGESFRWIAGLYYFTEDGTKREEQFLGFVQDAVPPFGPPLVALDPLDPALASQPANFLDPTLGGTSLGTTNFVTELESRAAFFQGTMDLGDRVELTVGLRYTEDDRTATRAGTNFGFAAGSNSLDYSRVDWSVTVDFDLSESSSLYGRVSTGYRAGGSSERDIDFSRTFDEENLLAAEIGLKSQFWNDRARFNMAIFRSEYDDFITTLGGLDPTFAATIETVNIGEAIITGAELDFTVVLAENTTIGLSYTFLDTELDGFIVPQDSFLKSPAANFGQDFRGQDISGDISLVMAPEHAATLSFDQGFAVGGSAMLNFHADYIYRSEAASNPNTGNEVPSLGLLNARVSLDGIQLSENSDLSIGAWVQNATDEDEELYIIGAPQTVQGRQFVAPTTYGVDVRINF